MVRFGICTQDQYARAGERRRFSGSRVSYRLLNVGENPTAEQIATFEDVSFTLRTSNGTCRTTFRNRFRDVDSATMRIAQRFFPASTELRVQDRAVSHGLTSLEWAEPLLRVYPRCEFEASDAMLYLVQLSLANGDTYIVEASGQPLQYTKPPFVVSMSHRESLLYPINHLIAARALWRFRHLALPENWLDSCGGEGYRVTKIPCIHPEVLSFQKTNPRFRLQTRSVFAHTPNDAHILRTMNILNRAYFSPALLAEGINAAFKSLKSGGIWIVGRTLEEDFTNHVTFFRRREETWEILERIGKGWELEQSALATRMSV